MQTSQCFNSTAEGVSYGIGDVKPGQTAGHGEQSQDTSQGGRHISETGSNVKGIQEMTGANPAAERLICLGDHRKDQKPAVKQRTGQDRVKGRRL
jgi:hypothetical protein